MITVYLDSNTRDPDYKLGFINLLMIIMVLVSTNAEVKANDKRRRPLTLSSNLNDSRKVISVSRSGTTYILLQGLITEDMASTFEKELSNSKGDVIVVLDMDGGKIPAAQKIADAVSSRTGSSPATRITTYVPHNGACTSACILVFSSAQNRVASRDSILGFHECDAEVGDSDQNRIVSRNYIEKIRQFVPSSEPWLKDFEGAGFPKLVANTPAFLNTNIPTQIAEDVVPSEVADQFRSQSGRSIWGRRGKWSGNEMEEDLIERLIAETREEDQARSEPLLTRSPGDRTDLEGTLSRLGLGGLELGAGSQRPTGAGSSPGFDRSGRGAN